MIKVNDIEDRVGEFITTHIVFVCAALVVIVGLICAKGCDASWLTPCGAIIGGSIAIYQWASDRRVRRSELLNNLVMRFSEFNIEQMVHADNVQQLDEEKMCDLLAFLSYVCHLYRTHVLSSREFSSLKWNIVKLLECTDIFNFIRDAYGEVRKLEDRPYHDLLVVGWQSCNDRYQNAYWDLLNGKNEVELDIGNNSQVKPNGKVAQGIMDFVGSEKEYKNHLEVLNEIFNMGYRGHQRGAARLRNGDIVWFPKYTTGSSVAVNNDNWINVLTDDGCLKEYIPRSRYKGDEYRGFERYRYVFGIEDGTRNRGYKFLGVYRFEKTTAHSGHEAGCCIYKRIKDVLLVEDIKQAIDHSSSFQ